MNGLKRMCMTLACLGLLVPNGALAATPKSKPVSDVKLVDGTLTGTVVDAQGRVLRGVPVQVRFAGMTVARTTSNDSGRFAVAGMRSGVHQIVTPRGKQTTRCWTENAPVSAKTAALVVNTSVVRGQEYVEGGDVYYGDAGGEVYYDDGYGGDGGYYEEGGISGATIAGGLVVVGLIAGIVYWIDEANDDGGRRAPASP